MFVRLFCTICGDNDDYRNYVNRLYSKQLALTPLVEVKNNKQTPNARTTLVNLFQMLMMCCVQCIHLRLVQFKLVNTCKLKIV